MANNEVVITQTLKLDHCWVCLKKINESNTEHHHVVPRSYGGENGPTVSLCCDCHTCAHKTADSLYARGNPIVPYQNVLSRERCLYLAQVICSARTKIESNPENKRYVYSGFFDSKTHGKLVRITESLKMSQKKVIVYAIDQLYARLFK